MLWTTDRVSCWSHMARDPERYYEWVSIRVFDTNRATRRLIIEKCYGLLFDACLYAHKTFYQEVLTQPW